MDNIILFLCLGITLCIGESLSMSPTFKYWPIPSNRITKPVQYRYPKQQHPAAPQSRYQQRLAHRTAQYQHYHAAAPAQAPPPPPPPPPPQTRHQVHLPQPYFIRKQQIPRRQPQPPPLAIAPPQPLIRRRPPQTPPQLPPSTRPPPPPPTQPPPPPPTQPPTIPPTQPPLPPPTTTTKAPPPPPPPTQPPRQPQYQTVHTRETEFEQEFEGHAPVAQSVVAIPRAQAVQTVEARRQQQQYIYLPPITATFPTTHDPFSFFSPFSSTPKDCSCNEGRDECPWDKYKLHDCYNGAYCCKYER